ncbi:ComF family protein [Streptomyces sp. NBC_00996]|uniref:ComF family protein n=1 Tax=Streptomyces sp. NBC_00996 TaxID=2903710 RepID=UPI0038702B53|nr:ComF family protein [Streptomyces sp. NBC_00996]
MRGWWQDLTDLVLPAECGGCGRPRTVLCPECRAVLSGAAPSRVRPVPEPAGLPVVHAAAPYEDEVRAALLAHKERGALALAAPLGVALAGAVRAGLGHLRRPGPDGRPVAPEGRLGPRRGQLRGKDGQPGSGDGQPMSAESGRGRLGTAAGVVPGPVLLVPVPSSRRAVRARGHDPARRIALAAAGELRRTGSPARVLSVLVQRRAVADQSGLNSRQRLDNLAGALEVAAGGARLLADGGWVVLVDDLMTTGASLTEAARAVQATEARAEGADVTEVVRRMAGTGEVADTGRDAICAAVVAAAPDAFEINRN